jgi:serine protease Do
MRKLQIAAAWFATCVLTSAHAETIDAARAIGVEAYSMGAFVAEVKAGSAAEAAGLEPGDFIYYFDGKGVTSAAVLSDLLRATPPGKVVQIYVIRGKQQIALNLAVGDVPAPDAGKNDSH